MCELMDFFSRSTTDLTCNVDDFDPTECWSQGRAKLRDFPRHCGAENTQPSPSFIPTLGSNYNKDLYFGSRGLYS